MNNKVLISAKIQLEPFERFRLGHYYATIGYWLGDGDEQKFQILATVSDDDHYFEENDFYNKVVQISKIVGEGFADEATPLMIYHRMDSPTYLDVEGNVG